MYGTSAISALFQKEFLDSKSLQNRIENQIRNSKLKTENRKENKTKQKKIEEEAYLAEAHQTGPSTSPPGA
jgi:hypothetical protein